MMYLDFEHCNFELKDGPGSAKEGTWSALRHDPEAGWGVLVIIQGHLAGFPVATQQHGKAVLMALRSHGNPALVTEPTEAPEPDIIPSGPCEEDGG